MSIQEWIILQVWQEHASFWISGLFESEFVTSIQMLRLCIQMKHPQRLITHNRLVWSLLKIRVLHKNDPVLILMSRLEFGRGDYAVCGSARLWCRLFGEHEPKLGLFNGSLGWRGDRGERGQLDTLTERQRKSFCLWNKKQNIFELS